MRISLPLLLLASLLLGGCVEGAEVWTFDEHGGGTYDLTVRWNADLWRRVRGVLGPRVMGRLTGRAFPLRKAQWADGLEGLPGVEVVSLEEADTDTGLREISTRVKFRSLPDLLRWEVLARRTIRLGSGGGAEKAAGAAAPGERAKKDVIYNLYMEPLAQVPVLDRVGALLDASERPPHRAEGPSAEADPGPLERMGLERDAAELVWRMVKLPLAEAKLSVQVRIRGEIVEVAGRRSLGGGRELTRTWDFAALRKADTDRTIRLAWRPREFDGLPGASNTGDADPRRAPSDAR